MNAMGYFLFFPVLPFIVGIANKKIPMPASDKKEHVCVPHKFSLTISAQW